LKWCNSSK